MQAVIFDMDGLMINTEPLQSKAYEEILREYGKDPIFYPSGVVQKVGVREDENWEIIKKRHTLSENTDVLIQKRQKKYLDLLHKNITPQPGLLALIELLRNHGLKLAVASSSDKNQILLVLNGLNIRQHFSVIISSHEVPHGKPAPDVFIETAKQLQVSSEACLILEDAESGIIAAKAAHIKVIAVPNKFTKDQDVSEANLIVSSLTQITWEKIKLLEDSGLS